jgi:hypothetical protein
VRNRPCSHGHVVPCTTYICCYIFQQPRRAAEGEIWCLWAVRGLQLAPTVVKPPVEFVLALSCSLPAALGCFPLPSLHVAQSSSRSHSRTPPAGREGQGRHTAGPVVCTSVTASSPPTAGVNSGASAMCAERSLLLVLCLWW